MMEVLTLLAIAFGPFIGIWAHGKLEDRKRAYERRLDIFKTLMATRGETLSPEHVRALNRIELEFTGDKYKKIRELWTVYLDHLNSGPQPPPLPGAGASQSDIEAWGRHYDRYQQDLWTWVNGCTDRLVALLKEMSAAFDYKDFDEVRIKKGVYRPKGHFDLENAQRRLLEAAAETFEGRRHLPMFVVNWPSQTEEQEVLTKKLLSVFDGDGAYRVRLVTEPARTAAIPVHER